MAHIRNNKRCAAALLCTSILVLAGPVALVVGAGATTPSPLAPFPAANVEFVGYGDGPGVGMGQWGAFGYAVLDHERYSWILAHYYGGSVLASGDAQVSADPTVSVDINENDGRPLVVTSASPFTFGGHVFPAGDAARAVLAGNTWTLSQAPSCSSHAWTPVASGLTDPVATPFSSQPSASAGELLTVCEHGGKALAVRGTLEAYDAPSGAVSLSILPLEEYVRSVVSGEVSWSWGLFGGTAGSPQGEPWGFQALEAQAVATRSYVAAELAAGGWKPYATTCDVYCQSYPGISGEASDIDAAVADTVGEILAEPVAAQNPSGRHSGEFVQPAPGGPGPSSPGQPSSQYAPVLAEYSASTGGYTGGGAFPDVIDSGDSICIKSHYYSCNPCHKWVAVVPVTAIEKAFKSAGKLASIDITGRNGLGALGGRVETLVITGTSGTELSVPSWSLEPLLAAANPDHCASDWYGVSNGP